MQNEPSDPKQVVYVTVSGCVAYAARVPEGIDVRIIDFDDLKADYEGTSAQYALEDKQFIADLEAS